MRILFPRVAALAAAVLFCLLPQTAGAAPAWCGKPALKPAERTICGSVLLLTMDEELNRAYVRALGDSAQGQRRIRREQIDWLAVRNACGENDLCLHREYQHQIRQLRGYHRDAAAAPPPRDCPGDSVLNAQGECVKEEEPMFANPCSGGRLFSQSREICHCPETLPVWSGARCISADPVAGPTNKQIIERCERLEMECRRYDLRGACAALGHYCDRG